MATATKDDSMTKLLGKVSKRKEAWYYETTYMHHGRYSEPIEFCHDFTRAVTDLTSDSYKLHDATPSWGGGVVDAGALRMAVVCLVIGHLDTWHGEMDMIREYYRKYAEEVVAHLPNKFTLTQEEISDWVKKQEKK